jgi:formate hydrogenlyase subunit 3/multisubunit Na+/H+ antiporter MnhD subunit
MNAPLLWIVSPLIIAVILWFLQRRTTLVIALATTLCVLLALLALTVPIASAVKLGPWSFEVGSSFAILGRQFVLDPGDRPFLTMIYGIGAFWFFGTRIAGAHRHFIPIGMAVLALMVAALAVQPFLYAALVVEIAVLLSIPMLVPPGRVVGQGIVRYLIFQTLALPFLLFAGWAAAGVEANPTDSRLLLQAVIFLGLGFAFWLAVFPFYTWVPLLSQESHAYETGFILGLLPSVVLLLMLNFLDNYAWLRAYPLLPEGLQFCGALMVVTGGIWAAFQKTLPRLFGYAVIMESGFALLSISLQSQVGFEVFAASLFPRMLALALWALATSVFEKQGILPDFDGIKGQFRRFPLISSGLVLAYFSLAGLPLLGGFPTRLVLLENLAQKSLPIMLWVLLGNVGFLLSGLRMLAMLVTPSAGYSNQEIWKANEKWPQAALIVVGAAGLLFIGVFPRFFLSGLLNILQSFSHLY